MKRFFLYKLSILFVLALSLVPLTAYAEQAQLHLQIFPLECTVDLLNNGSGTLYSVTPENCLGAGTPPIEPGSVTTSPLYPYQTNIPPYNQISQPIQTDWLFIPSKATPSTVDRYSTHLFAYDRYATTTISSHTAVLNAAVAIAALLILGLTCIQLILRRHF